MEIPIPSLPILVSFLLSAFILAKLTRKSSRRNLPPGPRKLPLIGNLHNLIGSVPHRALHQLSQKHGPLMHLQLGEVPTVIVSSADAAKEVMKTHDVKFASRHPILAAEIMSYGYTSITFSPYGDYWSQLRKICTAELLSTKRVQSFSSLRERVYSDLMKWIASMEGSPLNLSEKLYWSTYSFTTTAALGKVTEGREPLLPIFLEGVELAAGFDIAELYPSVKLFRILSGVRRRLLLIREKADEILESIVQEHRDRAAVFNDREEEEEEDLLDVLLKFQDAGQQIPLTNDNIKAVLMDMLGGGSETSATMMNWAMAEMMKNPAILKKAQDEVRLVFDGKGYVEESRIDELKYLKSVVKETLRMHPPGTLLLRKCSENCEINEYEIAAETQIIVNIWAINRDPKYWENGDCFEPERFLDSSVDFRGNHMEYIPFGAGRRICPGMNFGLANLQLPLAMLLYHFDWKLAAPEIDMTEAFGITTKIKNDLFLVPLLKRPFSLPK
ncbi:hypothetical protein C2S53_015303 [Perilla frutescens var. hirtella]|uniref:Cytochrome P450 n=1 Tax=Perilla frutescens var. hirtella TaxID=608512 RepID=A0AAD4P5F6_PERFH|nr:hypothetical protein C2S53_015303 [Perilla frutescens var. hirtella]